MSIDSNSYSEQNPYAIPDGQTGYAVAPNDSLAARGEWMIVLIAVFSVFQVIVGMLEGMMAIFLIVYALFFPELLAQAMKQNAAAGGNAQQMPEGFATGIFVYLSVAGGVMILSAILRIVGGVRLGVYFKGRTLNFISLFWGLLSIASFYCACTSIPMMIFGLIVLLHPSTKYACQLASGGMTSRQIRDHFAAARLGQLRSPSP